jgi:2-polyprenyl-3-methyl-5-hydroxy-6-metoxy-1,4-benzoquinol methylase
VYFALTASLNNQDFDLIENSLERIIDAVNIIDAPYYLRYIINSRLITSPKLFMKLVSKLQTPNITLKYGNTAIQRRDYIKSLLNFDRTIVDIGCGEGFYAIPYSTILAQKNKGAMYYAIDINEAELQKVQDKALKKELNNIITLNDYSELSIIESCDVILTEVIEHMEPEASEAMIRWVLSNLNFNKIIITTPNFDFNKYYNLYTFRHEDHHWEPTSIQFKNFMAPITEGYKVTYLEIGDIVDGICCSQGILIQH